jgi:hypothetical protein
MGEVTGWSGNPVLLDSTVAKDQQIYDIVKKLKVLVDKRGNVKLTLSDTSDFHSVLRFTSVLTLGE